MCILNAKIQLTMWNERENYPGQVEWPYYCFNFLNFPLTRI